MYLKTKTEIKLKTLDKTYAVSQFYNNDDQEKKELADMIQYTFYPAHKITRNISNTQTTKEQKTQQNVNSIILATVITDQSFALVPIKYFAH